MDISDLLTTGRSENIYVDYGLIRPDDRSDIRSVDEDISDSNLLTAD